MLAWPPENWGLTSPDFGKTVRLLCLGHRLTWAHKCKPRGQMPGCWDQVSTAGQGAGLWPEGNIMSVAMGEAHVCGARGGLLHALSSTPFLPVGRPREPHTRQAGLLQSPRKSLPLLITRPALPSPQRCKTGTVRLAQDRTASGWLEMLQCSPNAASHHCSLSFSRTSPQCPSRGQILSEDHLQGKLKQRRIWRKSSF